MVLVVMVKFFFSGNVRAGEPVCAVGVPSAGDATRMLTVGASHLFKPEHPAADGFIADQGWRAKLLAWWCDNRF